MFTEPAVAGDGDTVPGRPTKRPRSSTTQSTFQPNPQNEPQNQPPAPPPAAIGRRQTSLGPDTEFRSYKLRMDVTPAQRAVLRQWAAAARWAYNATVDAVQRRGRPAQRITCTEIRQEREGAGAPPDWAKAVYASIRNNAMFEAIDAFGTNRAKQDHRRARGERAQNFEVKYRSLRRSVTETIVLDGRKMCPPPNAHKIKDSGPVLSVRPAAHPSVAPSGRRLQADVYFGGSMEACGPVRVTDSRRIVTEILADNGLRHAARILWDKRRDSFQLVVRLPRRRGFAADASPQPAPAPVGGSVVSLDPGDRAFQTWYDPLTGSHGELLAEYSNHRQRKTDTTTTVRSEMERRCRLVDQRQALARSPPGWTLPHRPTTHQPLPVCPPGRGARRTQRLWRDGAIPRQRWRRWWRRRVHQCRRQRWRRFRRANVALTDWRSAMHYDAIGFLWSRWETVVASNARFGRMCDTNNTRVFGSRTARSLYCWSHYTFNQRLRSRAFAWPGRTMIETAEDGTTGTCGLCGRWNPSVGASKIFRCADATGCGMETGRDLSRWDTITHQRNGWCGAPPMETVPATSFCTL